MKYKFCSIHINVTKSLRRQIDITSATTQKEGSTPPLRDTPLRALLCIPAVIV